MQTMSSYKPIAVWSKSADSPKSETTQMKRAREEEERMEEFQAKMAEAARNSKKNRNSLLRSAVDESKFDEAFDEEFMTAEEKAEWEKTQDDYPVIWKLLDRIAIDREENEPGGEEVTGAFEARLKFYEGRRRDGDSRLSCRFCRINFNLSVAELEVALKYPGRNACYFDPDTLFATCSLSGCRVKHTELRNAVAKQLAKECQDAARKNDTPPIDKTKALSGIACHICKMLSTNKAPTGCSHCQEPVCISGCSIPLHEWPGQTDQFYSADGVPIVEHFCRKCQDAQKQLRHKGLGKGGTSLFIKSTGRVYRPMHADWADGVALHNQEEKECQAAARAREIAQMQQEDTKPFHMADSKSAATSSPGSHKRKEQPMNESELHCEAESPPRMKRAKSAPPLLRSAHGPATTKDRQAAAASSSSSSSASTLAG